MSDLYQSESAPAAARRPGRLNVVIKGIGHHGHRAWGWLSWVSSLFLFAIGYSLFPILRTPVTWPWKTSAEVWGPALIMTVLIVVWLVGEVKFTVSRLTDAGQLQKDTVVSVLMAIVLCTIGGGMINANQLGWWFLLPWIGVIADALQSGYFGINNAFQKNPTEIMRGSD